MVEVTIPPLVMPADPRRHLPLKPVDLQLLLALAGGERHGYGLVQAIAEATDGLVQLDPGNLYRVVKRLLADELVGESARRVGEAAEPGTERRRYYALTPLGRQVLTAELRRLEALVRSPTVRTLVRGVPGWAA
jgi:DNA-binding PadR family transcriptional regulator